MKKTKVKTVPVYFLERIVEIRKSTGLSQEKFYDKYLKSTGVKELKTGSSVQGFMRDIESGGKECPLAFLPIYAKVGKCSIDSLFYIISDSMGDDTVYTARDVCRILTKIDEQYDLIATADEIEPNEADMYDSRENPQIDNSRVSVTLGFEPHSIIAYSEERFGDGEVYPEHYQEPTFSHACLYINDFLNRYFGIKKHIARLSEKKRKQHIEDILLTVPEDLPASVMKDNYLISQIYSPSSGVKANFLDDLDDELPFT